MTDKSLNISLPQGVRDMLPEEAEKARYVEETIVSVLEKNGFRRVITPLLEYIDVLSLGLGAELQDKIFKFVDPVSGKIIAIRPDITPQVARMVSTRMRDYPLPIKLYYNENILRCEEPRGGLPSELLQIGAEYIGEDSPDADAEVIATAVEAIKKVGVRDFKIDIGHIGFFKGILEDIKASKDIKKKIKDAVLIKDNSSLQEVLSSVREVRGDNAIKILSDLPSLFGDKGVIDKLKSQVKNETAIKALDDLASIINMLEKKKLKNYITIDLGEVRGFDYYTGVIFEGFTKGFGRAILKGGRYNNLLEKYGYPCPATENVIAAVK